MNRFLIQRFYLFLRGRTEYFPYCLGQFRGMQSVIRLCEMVTLEVWSPSHSVCFDSLWRLSPVCALGPHPSRRGARCLALLPFACQLVPWAPSLSATSAHFEPFTSASELYISIDKFVFTYGQINCIWKKYSYCVFYSTKPSRVKCILDA